MAERAAGNFYGRRKAKPLKASQLDALDQHLHDLLLDIEEPAPEQLGSLFAHNPEAIVLEIGFGAGEHLIASALNSPEMGFIGCEPFVNGLAKAVRSIAEHDIRNIRLYDQDATRLLHWLREGSLDRIDLFYPDPWPKRRHWKRRFVNRETVAEFARILRPSGRFRFASDIEHYVNWTLRHVFNEPRFRWTAGRPADWQTPFDGWVSTRYEKKALRENRRPAYLEFTRSG